MDSRGFEIGKLALAYLDALRLNRQARNGGGGDGVDTPGMEEGADAGIALKVDVEALRADRPHAVDARHSGAHLIAECCETCRLGARNEAAAEERGAEEVDLKSESPCLVGHQRLQAEVGVSWLAVHLDQRARRISY